MGTNPHRRLRFQLFHRSFPTPRPSQQELEIHRHHHHLLHRHMEKPTPPQYDDSDFLSQFVSDSTTFASTAMTPPPHPERRQSQPDLPLDPDVCRRLSLHGGNSHSPPPVVSGGADFCSPPRDLPPALPEFVGRGGGQGIFRPPTRAAVHPRRPPPVELRPRPLRETQAGRFIRTIAGSGAQHLWAGLEDGVRVWDLRDMFEGFGRGRFASWKARSGDEGSAPFRESNRTPPVMCLVVDSARGVVWSGHKDGMIRGWRIEQLGGENVMTSWKGGDFAVEVSWQAHQAAVLSMVLTAHGDLWSGSEGGIIMAWPGGSINKALMLKKEEKYMASSLVERTFVHLRSLAAVAGVTNLPNADVKYLVSDRSSSKVWSGSYYSFALWDSFTKELLKIFNIDGQVETCFDTSFVQDTFEEDNSKISFASTSRKAISFFQRSHNALMGAADAVRKAAVRGAFGDDNRRTEALTISIEGMIWSGCANGLLVKWDCDGQRLKECQHHYSSIQSLCSYGEKLWVGYTDGLVQVLSLEGSLLGGWVAHCSPVVKMVVEGSYLLTLANHGGLRGWNLASPGPIDRLFQSELIHRKMLYTRLANLKIMAGTWNVGQERALDDSLISWLGCEVSRVEVIVVGLQEVEMGAGFLAMAAAKETVGLEGSANGQWWIEAIERVINEGNSFVRIGSRQLAGLLVAVWAKESLKPYVGDVDAAAVPCGFGRAIGNKGAVGLRMRIFGRQLCFVNCHFAAHMEAVDRRNSDFDHVYQTMNFTRPSSGLNSASVGSSSFNPSWDTNASDGRNPELSEADMVVFLGDFNYRIQNITYEEAISLISQGRLDELKEKDQLRTEMKAGRVFQGLREGEITYVPTYKFERYQAGISGYDLSEKKRIPAWCDRILYRDSRTISRDQCSLEFPVVSNICKYDSCMDAMGSDHKPVKCIFSVSIAHIDELTKRNELGKIMASNDKIKSYLEDFYNVPEITISSNNINLQGEEVAFVRITSKCGTAIFSIISESQSPVKNDQSAELHSGISFVCPKWLEVSPATGIIKPGRTIEVSIRIRGLNSPNGLAYTIQDNWWQEDTSEKTAILTLNVTGNGPGWSKSYQIHVQRYTSADSMPTETKVASRWTPPDLL